MQNKIDSQGRMAVYADAFGMVKPIDMHQMNKQKDLILSSSHVEVRANMGDSSFQQVDFASWLPACSKEYKISADLMDYIFVPVITMPSTLPNRNGVGFPLRELLAFSCDEGRLGYQTFKGKRVHIEHKNENPHEAIGAIVDVALRPMAGYGQGKVFKLLELLAIDRSKDPTYANLVLSGEYNTYSMGAWVERYTCSYCEAEMGNCNHLHPRQPKDFYELNGKLVFRQVAGIKGFETSIVETPAYVSAISDHIMSL